MTDETMGLVPRSVKMIFEQLQKHQCDDWKKTQVTLSCIEIHIETVRDLLDTKNEQAQIMTNQNKFKPTEIEVTEFSDVNFVLKKARDNRKVAQTAMNSQSSRSHSIYQLKIKAFKDDETCLLDGALNLVDLAGSERADISKTEGERFKEMTAINQSLTSLGNVISSILKKEQYIPFRNSKLTNILKDFMGGDAKTLMIVNVSPL